MVRAVECGRMAAMERILKAAVFPEESANEKFTLQTLHREFHDADEANLLEEEDMHVFDCRPLSDPLQLVCCNGCQRPVKASQYAAHADRCKLLNSASDSHLDLGGNSGPKKPPRKGRKNIEATNGNNPGAIEEQKYEPPDRNEIGLSESNFDNHKSRLATQAREVQSPAPAGHSAAVRISETDNGDPPAPLATKVYYSLGNHRLRSELARLYRRASTTEHIADSPCAEVKLEK